MPIQERFARSFSLRDFSVRYKTSKQSGFTLVELSIVLVILGFIAAGIVVGQDMIRASELRFAVTPFFLFDAIPHC